MVGPKCLRLVEIVNSVGATSRRKKSNRDEREEGIQLNEDKDEEESQLALEAKTNTNSVASLTEDDLMVVPVGNVPNSGVNFILGEEVLEDVDAFVVNRQGAEAKR
jgi:hypothetical protein